MGTKIKLFITFLAFTAVVSVFSFFDVFRVVRSVISEPEKTPLATPEEDIDNDGLLNIDESYWNTDFENPDTDGDGFLDGEEVASRYSPTEPSPKDRIEDFNLTEKLANLAVGGLAEGSLNPNSPDFNKSMDVLASIVDDGAIAFIPEYDLSQLKTGDSSKENQGNYLKEVGSIWQLFFKTLNTEIKEIESKLELIDRGGMADPEYIGYFNSKKNEFNLIAQQWLAISVPKNWIQEHTSFLNLISGLAQANDSLARGKDDPMRAAIGFNFFLNLIEDFPNTLKLYADKTTAENLSNVNPLQ